jgi:cell division septation protein DedD
VSNKATTTILDFSQAKERGAYNPKHIEEGDYVGKIVHIVDSPTKEKDDGTGNKPQWIVGIVLDDVRGASYPYRCQLEPDQLWKLRNVFEAVGMKVGQRRIKVDPQKAVGKKIGVTIIDNEYNGKVSSQIDQVFPASDLIAGDEDDVDPEDVDTDEEETEEEPAPPARRTKAAVATTAKKTTAKRATKPAPAPEPEDEEEEEITDEDLEELDVDEL